MRTFSHWTPRYAVDRLAAGAYFLAHPDAPWLTRQAITFLESWLQPEFVGFEWGSGRSTLWLAQRTAGLISIEHDPVWFQRVQERVKRDPAPGVTLALHGADSRAYVEAARDLDDGMLDFALVDGARRDECALAILPKVRPGGVLMIDDAHRYLPSHSRAPLALGPDAAPASNLWRRVQDELRPWTCTWSSDGVRDTAWWVRR